MAIYDKKRRWSVGIDEARRELGEFASPQCCAMCDGEGVQEELSWAFGRDETIREVACWGCKGRGEVVHLSCGRCGHQDGARPDVFAHDVYICSVCGHHAPYLLWLPMNDRLMAANDDKER